MKKVNEKNSLTLKAATFPKRVERKTFHQMTKNNTMEYWKEEAKKNSDVVSVIKETKPKHLYHILTLVSIWPAAF